MNNISVVILTLNEEANLSACLESCSWCDDIVVFDSYSTDRTVDIAQQHGARVEQRAFDNYAAQRNASINDVNYKHPWLLMIDADERVPPSLAAEIHEAVRRPDSDVVMFRMRRKDFFFGRWLRRSSGYPTWFGRLIRPGQVHVKREVNEEFVANGKVQQLNEHLHHHPFNKGIAWWYERHNRYSTMEAAATLSERTERIEWKALFGTDPVERRRALKQIAYRIPARPLMVFIYLYILRLGILDGLPGYYFCAMRASYELMIDVKVRALKSLH
ncbi:MAG TPA: glycosyltransferase family 2 protein [Steroidobacteraceae bacterium]|nr:glycosyltransferase family 2 protein [Steroidobacteraceae bacterium]